jgi:hypothetical protein
MRHVSNLLNLSQIKYEKEQERVEALSNETASVINWLFKELRSNFSAFKQAWPTAEEYKSAKKVWLKAFMLAGINQIEQIHHGLNRCYLMEKPFVPSPGEFIAWCSPRPEDIGLPSLEEAYELSIQINRQFSDYKANCHKTYTVIKHAIDQIGCMNYRSMKADTAFKTFERYYAIACKQFIEGKLKEIPKALTDTPEEHPEDRKRSDEARLRAMEAIRKMGIPVAVKA